MADVRLAPKRSLAAGLTPTRTGALSVSDTYLVRNSGRVLLMFQKSGAGACTVTVQTPATRGGLALAERTVAVEATTGDVVCGPFPPSLYNDGTDDLKFTCDEITGLTVAVIEI